MIGLSSTSVSLTRVGETVDLSATVTDQSGNPMAGAVVSWQSSDPAVATVSSSGLVTALATGTADVMAAIASLQAVVRVTVLINMPPAITSIVSLSGLIDPNGTVQVMVAATDADGDSLTYSWAAEAGSISGSGTTVDWVGPASSDFYDVTVRVDDGRGGTSEASVSIAVRGFTLLVPTSDGIIAVDRDGGSQLFGVGGGRSIDVVGTKIYSGSSGPRRITEFAPDGSIVRIMDFPSEVPTGNVTLATYPDGFSLIDNVNDVISLVDFDGTFLATIPMPVVSNDRWQNVNGVWDGQQLVVSETGTLELVAVDVSSFQATVFRDLTGLGLVNLGDVEYADGAYFLTANSMIIGELPAGGGFTELARTPDPLVDFNLVGLAAVGDYLYSTANFAGKVFKTDIASGVTTTLIDGLNRPLHLTFYPVDLVGN